MRAEEWNWGSKYFPEDIRVQLLFKPGRILAQLVHVAGMHVISSSMVCSVNNYCVCGIYITSFSNIGASLIFFLHNYLCTSLCYSSYYLESNWDREAKQLSIILYNITAFKHILLKPCTDKHPPSCLHLPLRKKEIPAEKWWEEILAKRQAE